MISLDPASQSERDNYKLLIGSVVPRPIAFVTTLAPDGTLNAAPFSYFNVVTAKPPMVSVSIQRRNGVFKDTARNAIGLGAFVVHIADESYLEQLSRTATNAPPDVSEVALAGLTPTPSEAIAVPGIAEAKIRMECVLERAIPLGGSSPESPAADLLIGRVVRFHLAESIYENGRILAGQFLPVSRLAGSDYAKLGETFSLDRPV